MLKGEKIDIKACVQQSCCMQCDWQRCFHSLSCHMLSEMMDVLSLSCHFSLNSSSGVRQSIRPISCHLPSGYKLLVVQKAQRTTNIYFIYWCTTIVIQPVASGCTVSSYCETWCVFRQALCNKSNHLFKINIKTKNLHLAWPVKEGPVNSYEVSENILLTNRLQV